MNSFQYFINQSMQYSNDLEFAWDAHKEERSLSIYNPLIVEIEKRIYKENRNCVIMISGATGTGKSYSALEIADEFDPTFRDNLKERVVFNPIQFKQLLNMRICPCCQKKTFDKVCPECQSKTENYLKKGMAIIFDEAGVSMPSRGYQSYSNRLMGMIFQTNRYRNLLIIFTVPLSSFVDVQIRKLVHMQIETRGIENGFNKLKVLMTQVNPRDGEIYYRNLRIKKEDRIYVVDPLLTPKPLAKICHVYEKIAADFKDSVSQKGTKEEEKTTKKFDEIEDIAVKVLERKEEYIKMVGSRPTINEKLIELNFNASPKNASLARARAEQKLGLMKFAPKLVRTTGQ